MRVRIPRIKFSVSGIRQLILVLVVSVLYTNQVTASDQDPDRALFWSIHNNDRVCGYLLGTIHSEDPRVLDFSEEFLGLLRSNEVFAMELVPDLPTLSRLTEYMHLAPGQKLEDVVGRERFDALASALSSYQVPVGFISRMKPWAAMMTLSTPPPETGFFMDLSLSLRASGNGLQVVGLETLEQQLSFLENMPLAMQLSLLDQALKEFKRVAEVHDQMVDAYLQNDLQKLQELSDEQLQEDGEEASRYFIDFGIVDRNRRMAESLFPHLETNRVFVAVGALHLAGEQGLMNLLRREGYELRPLDKPFNEAAARSVD